MADVDPLARDYCGSDPPGLDCFTQKHMWIKVCPPGDDSIAITCWCMWCGTGGHDPDQCDDEGNPLPGVAYDPPIWHDY